MQGLPLHKCVGVLNMLKHGIQLDHELRRACLPMVPLQLPPMHWK